MANTAASGSSILDGPGATSLVSHCIVEGGWPAGEVEDYRVTVYQRRPAVAIAITNIQSLVRGQKERVAWTAQSNIVYQLQAASNLVPTGTWQDVGVRVRGPLGIYTHSHAPVTARYYRVVAPYVEGP